jgi:hypothetical protein
MKTFKDILKWYNNLDVLPFIEAVATKPGRAGQGRDLAA